MRIELIRLKTHLGTKKRAPWAAIIVPLYAGFMAFESIDDFIAWKANNEARRHWELVQLANAL